MTVQVPESLTHFLSLVELFECHTHQELVSILGLLQQKLLVRFARLFLLRHQFPDLIDY